MVVIAELVGDKDSDCQDGEADELLEEAEVVAK